MTYKLRAGAPFDLDNLFNIPPLDSGPLLNDYAPFLRVAIVDGGTFRNPSEITYDGGMIPLLGTATYDPTRVYGPDDIITN
jgi:hypothetical protein